MPVLQPGSRNKGEDEENACARVPRPTGAVARGVMAPVLDGVRGTPGVHAHTAKPPAASSRASHGDSEPVSSPTLASLSCHLRNAADNACGCVSTIPRQTIAPRSSTMQIAVRLNPTSSPANIVIASLLPSQGITSGKARLPAGEQQPHVWDVLYNYRAAPYLRSMTHWLGGERR